MRSGSLKVNISQVVVSDLVIFTEIALSPWAKSQISSKGYVSERLILGEFKPLTEFIVNTLKPIFAFENID